ncbi:MAG: nucleotidyltransferase family protein [Anaerolineae bacterium]|nr:nucleotidyltransferase family protein [Anaerolineae bacterium]
MKTQTNVGLGIADIIGNKRDEVLALANKHGAYNVRVFGSVARNEAMPNSDVDFLVEWDFARISPWGGAGLDIELRELLGRSVDVVTIEDLHPLMRSSVLEEAITL